MCNADCPEMKPCCLCQWNKLPYICNNIKCIDKDDEDYCAHSDAENARMAAEEASHEISEPPYDYVEIVE